MDNTPPSRESAASRSTDPYWLDKVFVVTGGSRGLGRAIAQEFATQGARVTIVARGVSALESAAAELHESGHDVRGVACDVTRQPDVDAVFSQTLAHYGRIDGLVNCAGISMRGTALDTTPEDFQRMFEVNVLAAVRCTRAAAGPIVANRGHIVNIGSLSGKAASRYMGAYPASKFALTGYTQQLRLELGPQGVHVLLVCPGPISRDAPRTYGAEEMANLPASAQKPGGGAKTRAIDPKVLAAKIVRACRGRQPELIVPASARLIFALMQISPALGDFIITRMTS